METLADILLGLHIPIQENLISKKPTFDKGIKIGDIDYVSWTNLVDLLDERVGLGQWNWEVRDINQVGNRIVLIGALTISGTDKALTMMATGSEDISISDYGDPSSNSEAMAMRRCAAKFGLGRDLWKKKKTNAHSTPTQMPKPKPVSRLIQPSHPSFAVQAKRLIKAYIANDTSLEDIKRELESEGMPTSSDGYTSQKLINELKSVLRNIYPGDVPDEFEATGSD